MLKQLSIALCYSKQDLTSPCANLLLITINLFAEKFWNTITQKIDILCR